MSALSFRRVPVMIYVGLAAGILGTLGMAIALAAAGGISYERFESLHRWRLIDTGCTFAQTFLVALGLFDLAQRQTGRTRGYAVAAAWLAFASLAWFAANIIIGIVQPEMPFLGELYQWLGRAIGSLWLAAALALIAAASGWRTAPWAAVGLIVLHLTGYWVPVVGEALRELVGADFVVQRFYWLGREVLLAACQLALCAALAATGRDPAPSAPAAARALRIARGALLLRVVIAVVLAIALFSRARSASTALAIGFAAPALAVIAMIAFAAAIARAGRAGIGLPPLRLAIGIGLVLWFAAVQVEQLFAVYQALREDSGGGRDLEYARLFSIGGPIVATLGIALVGSSISTAMASRGHVELAGIASARSILFVVLSLIAIGSQVIPVRTLDSALMQAICAAAASIGALVALVGLLRLAAEQLETETTLPPARVVDDGT